jgi:hypothetical protein
LAHGGLPRGSGGKNRPVSFGGINAEPLARSEAVKKFRGSGNGKRYHFQGTAKIYLPKEALNSPLSAGYELMLEGKWKSYGI